MRRCSALLLLPSSSQVARRHRRHIAHERECPPLVREPLPTCANSHQTAGGINAISIGVNWGGLVAAPG